jgi:hypothetical protein
MHESSESPANSTAGPGAPLPCQADWRRPDGYWRCDRELGHRGRHHLRAALDARPIALPAKASVALVGQAVQQN